jgi:hypothetical protein
MVPFDHIVVMGIFALKCGKHAAVAKSIVKNNGKQWRGISHTCRLHSDRCWQGAFGLTATAVIAGHSASEDGRERAYVPAIHVFAARRNKTWMPATSAGMIREW